MSRPLSLTAPFRVQPRGPGGARACAKRLFSGFAATGMALVLLSGCEKPAAVAPKPPVVQVMEVKMKKVDRSASFIGTLDSPQNVQLRARVESFVGNILFTEGEEVKEGALLIELNKQPYLQKLADAKAVLAEANAALGKSNIDVPRLKVLVSQSASPQRELETAQATKEKNEANVASAEARVKSAELDLGYCDIRAPLAGRIGIREVPVGSLVGKGEPTLLATISQLDPIWFYCAISEVDYLHAEKLASGAGRKIGELPVQLVLADGTEHPDSGKWVFFDRVVDAATGTIRARAEFPNSRKALRPGMFARVRLSLPDETGNLVVPERALVELQGKSFLWVIGDGNKASQRAVKAAPNRVGSEVIILEGVQPGERIVVEGVQKVREGAPVQLSPSPDPAGMAPPATATPGAGVEPKGGKQ